MSKTKLSLITGFTGFVVLTSAIFGIYRWAADPNPYDFPTEKVMTYNCEYVDHQPTELLEFCADGNCGIQKIKWRTWSGGGADGTGVYFRNDCEPDCASGKFSYTDVALYLDSPIEEKGKVFLTALTYEEINKSGGVVAGGISGGWDVSEMYRIMNA